MPFGCNLLHIGIFVARVRGYLKYNIGLYEVMPFFSYLIHCLIEWFGTEVEVYADLRLRVPFLTFVV